MPCRIRIMREGGITTLSIMAYTVSIAALSAYVAYIYHSSIKTELVGSFINVHIFAVISLALDFIAILARETELRRFLANISSVGGVLCSVSLLHFSLILLSKKSPDRIITVLLYSLPAICLAVFFLWNKPIIVDPSAAPEACFPYRFSSALEYMLRVAGCVLLAVTMAQRIGIYPFEVFLFVFALASFTLKILVTFFNPVCPPVFGPITALTIFGMLFFGSARLGMLITLSLGIRRSLELYSEPAFILDGKGNRVYMNPACARLSQDTIQAIHDACLREARHFREPGQEGRVLELEHNNGIYTISIRVAKTLLQRRSGLVCLIHDDTALKAAINKLKEKNEELVAMNSSIRMLQDQIGHLAAIEERNNLAKEIHDVMGHSLNLALHTLESNRLILDRYPEKTIMRLRQVIDDIDRGIDEITANNGSRKDHSPLWSLLDEMADRMEEIGVRLDVIRSRCTNDLTDEQVRAIYRICQEATTNAIRHGKADHITISIKEKTSVLDVHIIDNGKGCGKIIKGNGLKGMEERAGSLGGVVRFNSFEDGKGFMVHASIPLVRNDFQL